MRVLLMAYGSRGDIAPLAGLAAQLRNLGAEVRVCAPPDEEFAELLAGVGAELVPFGRDVRALRTGAPPSDAAAFAAELVAAHFETVGKAAEGCDVLVASGLMPAGARSVAEKLGIRYVYAGFHPFEMPSAHYRPSPRPGPPVPPDMTDNQALWDLDAQKVNALYLQPLNAHRAAIGLAPVDDVRDHVFTERPWLAVDPVLGPWQQLTNLDLVQTGAWILPDERPLPADLEAFLDAGTPPVYVGFGSMPMSTAADVARTTVEAARAQNRRVLVSRGWADLGLVDDAEDCFAVGDVNHQFLFRRVAAVVHHGGAGTTTTAARAGAPQVVVPQFVDQPHWATRVAELGIGAAHDGPTPTFESLSAALRTALTPETEARAKAVAGTIRTDGTAVAAKLLLDTDHAAPMSREQISVIAHADHPIKSPLDDDSVSRLLERGLPRGDERVLDLGCGTAEWLLRALATRPHLHAEGVDVSEVALTQARRAASELGVDERLVLHRQEAADFGSPHPFDLVISVGATHAFGGLLPTLAAARKHLAPGGRVLIGESFWDGAPSPAAVEMFGDLADLATTVDRVVADGWTPVHGHVSTRSELDAYEWACWGSLASWALDHPADPASAQVRETATAQRSQWLHGYRDSFGFLCLVLRRTSDRSVGLPASPFPPHHVNPWTSWPTPNRGGRKVSTQMQPTFVLVHGAFANSFSFAPLQAELGLLGHRSVAVDLPGHGFQATFTSAYQSPQDPAGLAGAPGSIKGVTLADNVAHLIGILERAKRNGPVILVAHSRGGITVTAAANARPDLIDRIVYVSAWCPVHLDANDYYAEPEMATVDPAAFASALAGNPADLGLLRVNFRTAEPESLAAFKAAFLADGTDEQFLTFLNTFQPDENLDVGGSADRAQATTWGRIPKTYIRLTDDTSLPLAIQDRLIREGNELTPDNPYDVRTLAGSHLMWLVDPAPAARVLSELATLPASSAQA